MLIGYARVSTETQNLDMQIQELQQAGCEKIFAEKVTGTKADRPEYNKMKSYLRDEHDVVVVYKLDRLGRSLKHLIEEIQGFDKRKIGFKSLQENIDTVTPGGRLVFHIIAAMAEFERDIIKERTLTGLSAARARGRLGGRPRKLSDNDILMVRQLYANKDNKIKDICKKFNIGTTTLFKIVSL